MITRNKAIVAAVIAALLVATIALASAISNARTARLEREVEAARAKAETLAKAAEQNETKAAAYKEKIEYLERNLSEIRSIAKKQDEELEIYNRDVSVARDRFDLAKRVRSIAATADELCTKLAELGHPCE
jgi:predicted  nucleic acid-binding Zn-ribbon protein